MIKIPGRMKRGAFLAAMLLSCFCMVGWGESWEDIRKESAKVSSFSADFTQSKYMKILTKPLVSKGRFYFQAPDSVRWEYTAPVKSILLMSRHGIKRYTHGSRGLVEDGSASTASMQVVLREISQWSQGRFTDNEHFAATLQGGREPKIILTPKEKGLSEMISCIVITLSADRPGQLKSVRIEEGAGNYTSFAFSNVKMNGKISESLFRTP
jgi:outer membrane lipoprotein-sorting protein